jgi:hypothetical protein
MSGNSTPGLAFVPLWAAHGRHLGCGEHGGVEKLFG